MTQSVYAWMGSPLHLVLEDDVANAYNRFQESFFQAQLNYKQLNGVEWTPDKQLSIHCTSAENVIWNKIGDLINLLVEINGGSLDITEEQMTSDFLVKL